RWVARISLATFLADTIALRQIGAGDLAGQGAGARLDLPGVLVVLLGPVGDFSRGGELLEGEGADPHPRVKRDRHAAQVGELHRGRAVPAGLEDGRSRVH